MMQHPRYVPVKQAELDLTTFVIDWFTRHDLSYLEGIRALQNVQARYIDHALQVERHPRNPGKGVEEA